MNSENEKLLASVIAGFKLCLLYESKDEQGRKALLDDIDRQFFLQVRMAKENAQDIVYLFAKKVEPDPRSSNHRLFLSVFGATLGALLALTGAVFLGVLK